MTDESVKKMSGMPCTWSCAHVDASKGVTNNHMPTPHHAHSRTTPHEEVPQVGGMQAATEAAANRVLEELVTLAHAGIGSPLRRVQAAVLRMWSRNRGGEAWGQLPQHKK